MKVPDSGMPEEGYWESLLDVALILDRLKVDENVRNVAELGCGYGTFTLPTARRVTGFVYTYDIDSGMVARTCERAAGQGVRNVRADVRDVLANGFKLPDGACDACLLFNILHLPEPGALILEAKRILTPGGRVLAIHWRSDLATPRGPALAVRPSAGQIQEWGRAAGLKPGLVVELPPWHFGVALVKPET